MRHISAVLALTVAVSGCSVFQHGSTKGGPTEAELDAAAHQNQRQISFDMFPREDKIAIYEDSKVRQHALTKTRQKIFVYVSAEAPKKLEPAKLPELATAAVKPSNIIAPAVTQDKFSPVTVHFEFGKAELKKNDLSELNKLASSLETETNIDIVIIGHTDSIGSDKFNMDLGLRRAKVVEQFLISKGLSASQMSITSRGEREPADTNKTAAGRANNRRVEVQQK